MPQPYCGSLLLLKDFKEANLDGSQLGKQKSSYTKNRGKKKRLEFICNSSGLKKKKAVASAFRFRRQNFWKETDDLN